MAAKGNGRNLWGWARRRSRSRSFLYETLPQTAERVTSSWFFEGLPVGDAGGIGTATAIASVTIEAAGSATGTSTALAVGYPPTLAIGAAQIIQSLYSQNPVEPISTWSTDLDVSTVDTGTDTITATGHGFRLDTCPGPFRLSTTGTLPSPLATGTDYWLIVPTQNTIKFATSGQNASTATAINLTTTGSGTHTLLRTIDTRSSGSALITTRACGVSSTDSSATTDGFGNNYSDSDITRAYDAFADSKVRTRVDLSATGGANHTITATMGDLGGSGDEITASIVEVIGARYLIDTARNETAIGSASISSPAITTTDEALIVIYLWGNGPVAQDHTWTAVDSNWTKLVEASAEQNTNNNGYIQCTVFWRKYATAQTALTASFSGTSLEGAQVWAYAFQASNPVSGVGSSTGTGTATGVGAVVGTGAGTAAGTGAASAVAEGSGGIGASDGVGSATATGTAVTPGVGSSDGTGTPAAVGASTNAAVGSASGIATPTATGAATAASSAAASGTGAATGVGAATVAGVGSSAGVAAAGGASLGTSSSVGASTGVATASAVGSGIGEGVGSSAGAGAATAVGASFAAAVGASTSTAGVTSTTAVIFSAAGSASAAATVTGVISTGTPRPLPALLTITARGDGPFAVAAFAGEAAFTVAPAVVAEFAITGPADMFAIGADPGPFVVTGTEPTFTVTAAADAPFTVEEV